MFASGGLLTPGILAEMRAAPAKGEFAPGSFRRLNGNSVREVDTTIEAGFAQLCDRFDGLRVELARMDRSALRDRWVLPLLRFLDWEPRYQAAHLRPSPLDAATFAVSHLGWDHPSAPPVHIEPTGEAGLDARPAPRRLSPHDLVQRFLNLADQQWGIVTDGRELRVLRDFHHSTAKGFVGVDLADLFQGRRFEDFRALYRLAHVSRFLPADPDDDRSPPPLESLYARSRAAGISVGRALHPQVRRAIEVVARGVVANDPALRDRLIHAPSARSFYGEVLRVVYRLLFLFFAEQRGMLPGRDTLYAETYSVTRLRDLADRPSQVEGPRTDLYEGLKVTFRLMSVGSDALAVKPFDGHLFDPAETPAMTAATITNRELLRAIRALTNVEVEGQRQHVAYATIGVEELGAVYESLLDYTPRIAEQARLSDAGEAVPTGGLYLEKVGGRELGSYYTPPELVDFTLEVSLDRLLGERLAGLTDPGEADRALLDLRVVDPACGSGAFLVAVIDRIAARLTDLRLDGAQPTEGQLAIARRDVLQHCIYGVDVDPFAVELCKVALWIHCAVTDLPLTFLDHRIQCGNSLIGWPLRDIPNDIPVDAYQTKSKTKGDEATKATCHSARQRNLKALAGQGELFAGVAPRPDIVLDYPTLWLEEERTPADVEKKATAYAEYLTSTAYRLWDAAANLWAASFFWTADYGDTAPVSSDYWRAREVAERYRDGHLRDTDVASHLASPIVTGASAIAHVLNAFHWPLRFPEIAERGGFDLVTGNPPWEQFESREQEWFALRAPQIASLTGSARKVAIARLEQDQPDLAREWRLFEAINARSAEFARMSKRFTPTGGKINTYLLFSETNANNTGANGRAGFIVKSSLGIDKGGQPVFQPMVTAGRVDGFYDIVNGGRGETVIFQGVAEVERFAVLSLGPAGSAPALEVSMMSWSLAEARDRKPVPVTPGDLRILNPITRSLPSFRQPEHWEIALRLQERHPTLDFEQPSADDLACGHRVSPENPWDLRYATLFNSTTDSGHFLKRERLEAEGWVLGRDMVFRHDKDEALPLYEGQLVNRYDHRARTYAGYALAKKYGKKPGIPYTTDRQKADPSFEIEPRYWMRRQTAEDRLAAAVGDRTLFAFRDVTRPATDQRCAKGALLHWVPATDTVPLLAIGRSAFEFVALFNATPFDFLVRGKMPGGHVKTVWMLSQVAVPPPLGLDHRIAENARKLSLTSTAIARHFLCEPHPWDPEERHVLNAETDALVAHAYGITEREYGVILDTFDVLARKETTQHGRFRFKDDCLAAYRRLG